MNVRSVNGGIMGRNPEKDRQQMEKTRARLLAAGREVILEQGLQGTQVRAIIRKAGLGAGTFYLHFNDLEDFLLSVVQSLVDELRNRVREMRGLRNNMVLEDPIGSIRKSFEVFFDYIDHHKKLALILLREHHHGGHFGELIAEQFELFKDDLADDLMPFAELGLIKKDISPRLAAEAILGMTLQLAENYAVKNYATPKKRGPGANSKPAAKHREELIKALTSISLTGLLAVRLEEENL
jgi:AcrR family transcriptional regulator